MLEMREISKAFPGVQALDRVCLTVRPGEIHALVGENGAGKSTLMKILSGVYKMDSGQILWHGNPVKITNPAHAQSLGISTIYQEFNLINGLSIAENVFLSDLPTSGPFGSLLKRKMVQETAALIHTLGLRLDPKTIVKKLTVAQQQIVEIAKALTKKARVIVMDEPTAALTEVEIDRLFGIIRSLTAQGVGVIYISHKLDEIFRLCDHITVLRDGRNVGGFAKTETCREQLIQLMVGREIREQYPKQTVPIGDVALEVQHLSVPGILSEITFSLKQGEILGVAGLMGAGQIPLARALFGLYDSKSGQVLVHGRPVKIHSPRQAIDHAVGLVTENRKEEGLILGLSVSGNISLASLDQVSRLGWILRPREARLAEQMIHKLDIRSAGPRRPVKNLSGGNQQKVVLAKWLATQADIIILCEPTRGIDVGAKVEIYRLMTELAAAGKALLFISSELPELLALSDRVLVMREGAVVAELSRNEATPQLVMNYATGGGNASA